MTTDWRARAACYGHAHPEWWDHAETTRLAADICRTCPVIAECLAEADRIRREHYPADSEEFRGTWGGVWQATAKRKYNKIAQCGTFGGYKSHKYRREPVCEPCREARSAYQRDYYQRRKAAS